MSHNLLIGSKGLHRPSYKVLNLRYGDFISKLGFSSHETIYNHDNFPKGHIDVLNGEPVYEIKNPFPFYGATYILKSSADKFKKEPHTFSFKTCPKRQYENNDEKILKDIDLKTLSRHLLLSLAVNSTSEKILKKIAHISCDFAFSDEHGDDRRKGLEPSPTGLLYDDKMRPIIHDKALFEAVANNPHLPDNYKRIMVLIPGAQGKNPIVGEYIGTNTHVWEYLRKNSYIPWGHYASNMAHDAIRYSVNDLKMEDMKGLRFLYYQRVYMQIAGSLGLSIADKPHPLDEDGLERLRIEVLNGLMAIISMGKMPFWGSNLWGWNYGFSYASSGYRLHASHQQIHNQYALVPYGIEDTDINGGIMSPYIIGELVHNHAKNFRRETQKDFFESYLSSIYDNKRLDNDQSANCSLIFFEDDNVLAYVPKAQRFTGEVHLMAKKDVGNILEADNKMRASIDRGILLIMKALSSLGAEMITVYEVSKRYYHIEENQCIFYCFLPRSEYAPGSMSEAQGRWIIGHYPEDFASYMKDAVEKIEIRS